jgi:hypothetical protein
MFVPKLFRVAKGGVVDLDTMQSGMTGTSMVGGTQLGGYGRWWCSLMVCVCVCVCVCVF